MRSFIQFQCFLLDHTPGTLYNDLPMNFLLVKLNHHLLGLASFSSYTRASNRTASSCRTCAMYCLNCSASCLSRGASYIYHSPLAAALNLKLSKQGIAHLVQWPCWVTWDSKVQVQRQIHNILLCLLQRRMRPDLSQAIAHEPDSVHEQTIGGALDLEVAEEGVCAEQREYLV